MVNMTVNVITTSCHMEIDNGAIDVRYNGYIILRILFLMVTTQITRIKNADNSETLKKHIDGCYTLPYTIPNLTTMLSGVTDPVFVCRE